MKHLKKITLPTYLTLIRLFCAPILVPFFIILYADSQVLHLKFFVATLFLLLGFTDYLDGFFARRYDQESMIGAALDHLADKFLTVSAFIALVAVGKLPCLVATILVCREFFMMGMREIGLQYNIKIIVSSFGKIKTALHIALITWIVLDPHELVGSDLSDGIRGILLCASLLISIGSAIQYFIIFYRQLKKVGK